MSAGRAHHGPKAQGHQAFVRQQINPTLMRSLYEPGMPAAPPDLCPPCPLRLHVPAADDARSYFGMMTVSVFPMVALAQIVNILFLNVFFLYGGFFITYPAFPIWWKW